MRLITRLLVSLTLAAVSCVPSAATSPTAAPPTALTAPSPAPSVAPAAPSVTQPSVSPTAAAAPEVKIVEPPFRPQQEWTYSPAEITVKVGTQIVWTNTGAVAHTVTADDAKSFDSGNMDPQATFKLTPTTAGTFAYHCTFHPWMKATLVVSP